ncbi:MAG: RidA family protein [Chloroflexi bacterium]|nr:RidA family protein [Chloroflexota bacterium]
MPERKVVSKAISPSLPFSKVIGYGDLLFVSGLVGRNHETGEISTDIKEQTRLTMENISRELEIAGTSLDNVLKATVFITDMKLFQEMNGVYRSFYTAAPPARSCVEVKSLPDPEALVEIEVIAGR